MTLINADRLSSCPVPQLVKGRLPVKGFGFAWGASFWGKSLAFGTELALAVCSNTDWLGAKVLEPGPVAYYLGEGLQDAGLRIKGRLIREQADRDRRAAEIAREDSPEAAAAWLAGLPPYTDDLLYIGDGPFQLPVAPNGDYDETLEQEVQVLKQIWPRLVILDSYRDFTAGYSSIHETSANKIVKGIKYLVSELDCLVLLIAHPDASGRKMLGNDRLFNAADFMLRLQPAENSDGSYPPANGPRQSAVHCQKMKPMAAPGYPFQYITERIDWRQPPVDPETEEEVPGVPEEDWVPADSKTVRLVADDGSSGLAASGGLRLPEAGRRQPGRQLPRAVPPPEPERRRVPTGVKPAQSPFRAVSIPAPDSTAPAAGTDRERVITAILAGQCPDCAEGQPGHGCNPAVPGTGLTVLGRRPLVTAHVARVDTAATAGQVSVDEIMTWFPEAFEPVLAGAGDGKG